MHGTGFGAGRRTSPSHVYSEHNTALDAAREHSLVLCVSPCSSSSSSRSFRWVDLSHACLIKALLISLIVHCLYQKTDDQYHGLESCHHIKMKLLLHMAWLAAVAIAAPTAHWGPDSDTNGGRGAYNGWDGSSKDSSYSDFGKAWHHGRGSKRGSCDLKNAVMPAGKNHIHNIHNIQTISIDNTH